jgi:transcriptional regulator with XRE-family HTH domain
MYIDGGRMQKIIIDKMKDKKLSQKQLAEMVGVKQQYISKIILGNVKSPSFKLMVKISDSLDIPLEEFAKVLRNKKS